METRASETPLIAGGVVSRTLGGETILVPVATGIAKFKNIYLLNKVASFIWQSLDGKRGKAELCALVRDQFAVPDGHDVGADVDRFLEELRRRELVKDLGR